MRLPSPSLQGLKHLKLSLGYVHIIGFVVPNFPLDEYLLFLGLSFLLAKVEGGANWFLKASYDWMFVSASWDIAFHVGHPKCFCGLSSWAEMEWMEFSCHPIAKEGRK